jgi:hypothetical protein
MVVSWEQSAENDPAVSTHYYSVEETSQLQQMQARHAGSIVPVLVYSHSRLGFKKRIRYLTLLG